jgi:flagellar hook-associated protein 3 FlgL
MRVTDQMKMTSLVTTNLATQKRLDAATRRAAAGTRVLKPSDDPSAYALASRHASSAAKLTAATRGAREAADEVALAERTLDAGASMIEEALASATQGANDTMSPNDRANLGRHVTALRDGLISLANSRGPSGYLFGGTNTATPPFDPSGAFTGNDGVVELPLTDGTTVRRNVSGARAFTAAGGQDVFANLTALSTALNTNNVAGIRSAIDALQSSHSQLVGMQADAGMSIERLTSAADVMDQSIVSLAGSQSRALGADDPAGLFTELSLASASYEQSLAVTRRLLAIPSLASSS